MAYNSLSGDTQKRNVGQKYSPTEKLARTIKFILTPVNFQFATMAEAIALLSYHNAIEQVANRIHVLPFFYENEDGSEENVKHDFTGGDTLEVRKGRYAETNKMHVSVGDMIKLASFDGGKYRIIEIDANGNLHGTSPDGVVFQGFETTEFSIDKMNRTAGDVKRLVPAYVKYREPSEWTEKGVVLQPLKLDTDAWDPRDLDGLTDVELTVNTQTSTNINVTVEAYLKGVLLSGFDEITDWILTDAQTITGVTDNNDGTYDLAGTGLVTGTINLAASADLSQRGYESTGAKTVTIA